MSFTITVVAFAVTVGWSVVTQRAAAQHSEELATGYVPVALKLGQLRATQATLSTLIDGIPDERNPIAMRTVLQTLVAARRTKFLDTRVAVEQGLGSVGSAQATALAARLSGELKTVEQSLDGDLADFDRLFAAIAAGDRGEAERVRTIVGATEHDAERRLHQAADDVSQWMTVLSEDARVRERRAIVALVALAVLTLGVGVAVSIHTRRLLAPLQGVTERATAVARGDLVPRAVSPGDDEIGQLAQAFERMVAGVASAQEKAVANERFAAIGKMAAHVTHEIRNPLSSIGLNLELLDEELQKLGPHDDASALLRAVSREVNRLELLSEEYLRLARLPSPRMEAEDIAGTVRDVADFSRAELERSSVTISVAVEPDLPPVVFDESQIRQALQNLLRNAREAMPQGGEVSVRVLAEGMSVVIRVDDRGGGIPEEIRAHVFDPFFSTKGEGTGLGLAITRQIVLAHGGTLDCEPREGGGTSFRIGLPLAPARATSVGLTAAPRSRPRASTSG
ncbi:MAG: HAMP domain-containing sensor histidine kinase [Polyangiaceae bacterium]